MLIRLNKFLSQSGIASRRQSDEFIKLGEIKVNGRVIKELGFKINPGTDQVQYQNQKVVSQQKIYLLLNKPKGYLCTTKDRFRRPKVIDLVKGKDIRLYPVGRLDFDTEGLLLLTNDGDFAYKLTHPRHQIAKTYVAELNRSLNSKDRQELEKGIILEEGKTLPAKILTLGEKKIQITIFEGKKRQIKRMLAIFNYKIKNLKRIAVGPLKLGNLSTGKTRRLTRKEFEGLLDAKGLHKIYYQK